MRTTGEAAGTGHATLATTRVPFDTSDNKPKSSHEATTGATPAEASGARAREIPDSSCSCAAVARDGVRHGCKGAKAAAGMAS